MILAPSILSSDYAHLAEQVAAAAARRGDLVHVDVMDGHFVPNITLGPPIVAVAPQGDAPPLDVHLMIENADRYLEAFVDAGAAWIRCTRKRCRTCSARWHSCASGRAGRAWLSTPPPRWPPSTRSRLELDFVLVMSVNPGFEGRSSSRPRSTRSAACTASSRTAASRRRSRWTAAWTRQHPVAGGSGSGSPGRGFAVFGHGDPSRPHAAHRGCPLSRASPSPASACVTRRLDQMGVAHHAEYFAWFEVGRTDLLRQSGHDVSRAGGGRACARCHRSHARGYLRPVLYDDLLEVRTEVTDRRRGAGRVRLRGAARRDGRTAGHAARPNTRRWTQRGGRAGFPTPCGGAWREGGRHRRRRVHRFAPHGVTPGRRPRGHRRRRLHGLLRAIRARSATSRRARDHRAFRSSRAASRTWISARARGRGTGLPSGRPGRRPRLLGPRVRPLHGPQRPGHAAAARGRRGPRVGRASSTPRPPPCTARPRLCPCAKTPAARAGLAVRRQQAGGRTPWPSSYAPQLRLARGEPALLHRLWAAAEAGHGLPSLPARQRDGEPIHVFGDGRQTRDFTFVSDIVAATAPPPTPGGPGASTTWEGERVVLDDDAAAGSRT